MEPEFVTAEQGAPGSENELFAVIDRISKITTVMYTDRFHGRHLS